ncbi:thioredoxin [Paucilactobacillus oligofermentans DSM 15707 = LMG 22743]|uniref:Thioredoxin n=1 Tax=Paucilactobacillus oligofermentans DSM 15707 = LMG 22743 TaxID=1423778 RepID=A0A0R1RUP8_9LACO|nr:aryl-sulfate sulfotransferase [Paucilactobacillus oligofermentans]KRL57733.1 thioredoxin [Paucilactobacillus oligofermentans DSM 15707 = LMG 22743]CUS26820.1 Arylsulfotransferase/thioredoxin domains-containing protein [Paucilactobacillus oligofermentans DSM 15707 = LMG 22743]
MGEPLVFPTGTVRYNPKKAWSGYTLVPTINDGILLFDMNGNEIRRWNFQGFPPKLLPGGHVIGNSGMRYPENGMQDSVNLAQIDYDGNLEWEFDHFEKIDDPGHDHRWMARQHHDFQREGQSVYYSENENPKINSGKTLILGHQTIYNPIISDKKLLDDVIYEIDWNGNILWQWSAAEHFKEFGFNATAKDALSSNPNMRDSDGGVGDFMHTNCASYLGPNHWYDSGDQRFKPNNIIMDSRESNILFIIDHESGAIVWRLGPDYINDPIASDLGQIIGQHSLHMIPQGLPGAGNLLLFDNGGWAGYGTPNPGSKDGVKNVLRDYSRILEINPVTMKLVWSVTPKELGFSMPVDSNKFYSPYVSNVQRLPNGNTLINEGSDGHVFEVTTDYEIVWEWISPYFNHNESDKKGNMIYRAFRYQYKYIPQEPKPVEVEIKPIDNSTFRLPGAGKKGAKKVIKVAGTLPYYKDVALCVATDDETKSLTSKKNNLHLFDIDRKTFIEIGELQFKTSILNNNSSQFKLVLFGAERCVHCKMLHPLLTRAIQTKFSKHFDSYYINVDENQFLTESLSVLGTPVVIIFKNGIEISRFRGELDFSDICIFLDDTLAIK